MMCLITLFLSLTVSSTLVQASGVGAPVQTVYSFGIGTWVENLRVRSNGNILASLITAPEIYQIDPFASEPKAELLYTFPAPAASALGWAEPEEDLFYVIASNFSTTTFLGTKGSSSIWEVDFRGEWPRPRTKKPRPAIKKIVDVPEAFALDGLTVLNATAGYLLAGDITYGAAYFIDTKGRKADKSIDIPLMKPNSKLPVGIDGLEMRGDGGDQLFFSNPALEHIIRLPVSQVDGRMTGPATIVTNGTETDDFTFDAQGDIFSAQVNNKIVYIKAPLGDGAKERKTVAEVYGPTACRFGKTEAQKDILYVSTTGGDLRYLSGKEIRPGKIVAIDLAAIDLQ